MRSSEKEILKPIGGRRRLITSPGDQAVFEFLHALNVEDLPNQLRARKPDIVHFAAHGATESLSLAREDGTRVELSAEMLLAFLPLSDPPRLVYLDACNSQGLASALVSSGRIEMAIGTTVPLTNGAARAGAVAFYEAVLSGYSVADAFSSCQRMLEAIMGHESAKVCRGAGVDPATEILYPVPALVADFKSGKPIGTSGFYKILLGVTGFPPSVVQVVFATDEVDFIDDKNESIESDLCAVVRGVPDRGNIWMDDAWEVNGDFRVIALGFKAGGGHFTLESTLCKALENQYRPVPGKKLPAAVDCAIRDLH